MNRKKRRQAIMNQSSTMRTFSWYGRPGWRGLGASLTIVIALVLMTGVVFAQPDSRPFATPASASEGADAARQADSDRWVAQGEYYAAIWEASASASTMRYQSMAADFASRMERSAAASSARYGALAASLGAGTGGRIQAAANPSMNVARWYAPALAATSNSGFFAQNPEMLLASRWAAENTSIASDNPELLLVKNWNAARAAAEAGEQVCTPEDFVC
jgi:hypothetical protein